ncbi:hypothetical protein HRbin41_01192 [bacterium HR41]|nr:hypothetical protein HRbin41_01192 [bacterium HR41]
MHHDDVAEGGDVGAAGRRRAEQQANLGHHPRQLHLVEEDSPGVAAAGEHLHLVGDARSRGVDEVDDRHLEPQRSLLDAHDLLDRTGPPRARLDGRIVGHQADRSTVDGRCAGDDAVGPEPFFLGVREQAVLAEAAGIDESCDPLAHRELLLFRGLAPVVFGPSR